MSGKRNSHAMQISNDKNYNTYKFLTRWLYIKLYKVFFFAVFKTYKPKLSEKIKKQDLSTTHIHEVICNTTW